MSISELTPEQTRYMTSILDKGLDSIDASATPEEMERGHSPISQFEDQTTEFEEMCAEMQSLQEKLLSLESKITEQNVEPEESDDYTEARQIVRKPRKSRSKKGSRSSTRSLSKSRSKNRLSSIRSSEKVIGNLERRISQSPLRRSGSSSFIGKKPYDSIKNELYAERRKNMKLEKELEVLKRKAQHHNAMEKRYKLLEEDYRNLVISYERSENIRKKQKVIIEKLKEDIENVETHKPTSKQRKNRYKY